MSGTAGSFTPAAVPECPYAPRMTRAQALALRAAGGLLENCVVVITDGPVIGTAGNTSPTEIELQPQSPTDLGQAALVHTTFDPLSAWVGVYDIDLGTGTLKELTDDFGNHAKDTDTNAATVETQVPWHLRGANFRDNYFEDSILTGFATAVGAFTDNIVKQSTLNFTGKTAGAVTNSEWVACANFVSGTASLIVTASRFHQGAFRNLGTGPVNLTSVEVDSNAATTNILFQAGDTQGCGFTSCKFQGTFRMVFNRTGGGIVSATGSTFIGGSGDALGDLLVGTVGGQTGAVFLTSSLIFARNGGGPNSQFIIDGPGQLAIQQSIVGQNNAVAGVGFRRDVTAPGSTSLSDATVTTPRYNQGPGAGSLTIGSGARVAGGNVQMLGAGALTISSGHISGLVVNMAVGSNRSLVLTDALVTDATFNIPTTSGGQDNFGQGGSGCLLHRATININHAAAQGSDSYQGIEITSGGVLTVNNPAAGNPVNNSEISSQAAVNLTAGGSFSRCRASNECTLNTGFSTIASIIEGQLVKTTTAVNINKLANVGFDNWV